MRGRQGLKRRRERELTEPEKIHLLMSRGPVLAVPKGEIIRSVNRTSGSFLIIGEG